MRRRRPPRKKRAVKEIITGIFRMHPRGFGFVSPEESNFPHDLFIPKQFTDNAVDGDRVEAEVIRMGSKEKEISGKIVLVLERGRTHLAGTVREIDQKGVALVFVPILGPTKRVQARGSSLKEGDRVVMKVEEWGDNEKATRCTVSHKIGSIYDPSCDIPAAVEEFSLRNEFPKTVLDEVRKWGNEVTQADLKGRRDLSKLETFTIDPTTAKDYDDALSLEEIKDGVRLGVHIADVAHYVRPKSALDEEAQQRCNSVYFPGRCLPMLPGELSEQLCSLRSDVLRLTVSVMIDFDQGGNVRKWEIVRSYIKSQRRFTYEEALEVLEGRLKSPHAPTLHRLVGLCHELKRLRSERGSLDFSLAEIVLELDAKGRPTGMKRIEYDITHQLVEEMMLKANELVARTLEERKKPLVFRVHEEPGKENLEEFATIARSFGYSLQLPATPEKLKRLFAEAAKGPHQQQLTVAFIRSMKIASYSQDNIGHFGLALQHYCHFTSPIRRYTDLVTQRLLFNEEDPSEDLQEVAKRASEQERIAFRAEMSVKLLKKLRLLNQWKEEDPEKVYHATVTRVKSAGLTFELDETLVEGFIHISHLGDDYFVFDPQRLLLVGRSTGKRYFAGEHLHLKLLAVDLILLEAGWKIITQKQKKK